MSFRWFFFAFFINRMATATMMADAAAADGPRALPLFLMRITKMPLVESALSRASDLYTAYGKVRRTCG